MVTGNPYVTGNVVGNSHAFVGRADILQEVLRVLSHHQNNAIVLYGQRRIGKTSVLTELKAKLPTQYIPIFFDLQDKAKKTLGELLKELARKIDVSVNPNKHKNLPGLKPKPETVFHETWLPKLLNQLPPEKSLVLLLDEFDVLDAPATGKAKEQEEKEQQQAGATFFPYLGQNLLTLDTRRLNFVFAIGRKIDDMTQVAGALFKGAKTQRVSLLNRKDTVDLIRLSEANLTLEWTDEAIEQVYQLTSGHPYLTQVLCSRVWHKLCDNTLNLPKVTRDDIEENVINSALSDSEGALDWLWKGLPSAERIISSALAGEGAKAISETRLENLLRESGAQKITEKLIKNAPRQLQDWDLIEPVKGGYRFRVELLRRWIAKHKPLVQVRDELANIEPEADQLYKLANSHFKKSQLDVAFTLVDEAIKTNPNHVGANLLLADILLDKKQPKEALAVLDKLSAYQPSVARDGLIRTWLVLAQSSENEDEQDKWYLKILEIDPQHPEVKTWQQKWQQRAEEAIKEGDLEKALGFYQTAKLHDKAAELEKKIHALQTFESFLNEVVAEEQATEIDAIFLYAPLKYYKVIHNAASAGKQPDSLEHLFNYLSTIEAESFIEELRNSISNALAPKSTTVQFADCLLNLYFFQEREVPVTLGFLSVSAEGLGGFISQCDKHFDEIKDRFSQIP